MKAHTHYGLYPQLAEEESDPKSTSAGTADSTLIVLLADDDEDDRIITGDAFREARLANELICVTDGEELMDYLYHRGTFAPPAVAPRPGLILLDLNMPRKDGREALREMKSDANLRSIPVVVLTTSETQDDIQRIYDLGAYSYVSKPVTFEGLVRAIKVIGTYWFQIVKLPDHKDAS